MLAHNPAMHDALIDYMRALSVAVSNPAHHVFANSAGYRQALEDIARAIDPLGAPTQPNTPG
jgi:hypothetical protein